MNVENGIIIYQTPNGVTKIDVRMEEETVWLTQAQMVELFQSSKSNISEHITTIFYEGELDKAAVVRNFRTTVKDGKNYNTNHYNLDVIISVGYRVKSHVGTKFRQWALGILKEYMIKGFAMDDERLENLGGGKYFEELLERIVQFDLVKKFSGVKFWKYILQVLIMIRILKQLNNFSR